MKRLQFILTVALVVVLMTTFAGWSWAAPFAQTEIVSVDSVYVDPGQPTTNVNEGLLFISGNGAGGTSQISLIKFDLGSVSYSINKARINLAIISDQPNCSITSDTATTVSLYKVDSIAWAETEVTYNTKPTRDTLIMSVDVTSAPAHFYLTDAGGGLLSSYLESERTSGDKIAGFWIETTTKANQVIFEDDESAGQTAGCAGGDLKPTLQLADSSNPLSVTLRFFRSADPALPWPLIAGGLLFAAATAGVGIYRWRMSAIRSR